MSKMFRREYCVTHGRDGHALLVRDCWRPAVIAELVVNTALAALGHPCCGRGLGRIPHTDMFWYSIMQWPCTLASRDKPVLSIPLTVEQAAALRPDLVDDRIMFPPDGTDEFGYTWQDAVMIGTPHDEMPPQVGFEPTRLPTRERPNCGCTPSADTGPVVATPGTAATASTLPAGMVFPSSVGRSNTAVTPPSVAGGD